MKGRKALVSGGSSGIGRAIAQKLSEAGTQTAVADIAPPDSTSSDRFHTFRCDVSSGPEVDTLFQQVHQQLGKPDILICSAGRGIHEKLTEGDPEKWRHIIETNLLGALRMVRAFTPGMLEAGHGDVIFLSSVAAQHPYTYGGVYAATKSALEVVAETLRLETLPLLRVTVIAPGVTDTRFFENTVSGYHTAKEIGYGAISPEEVAGAVLYAVSRPPGVSVGNITIRPTAQPF